MKITSQTSRFFLLALAIVGLTACGKSGVAVRIKNESRGTVTNVQIVAGSHIESISEIALHAETARTIEPIGESGLEIRFTNADGDPVSQRVDVYLDRGLSGEITVEIDRSDRVIVVTNRVEA